MVVVGLLFLCLLAGSVFKSICSRCFARLVGNQRFNTLISLCDMPSVSIVA